MRHVLTLVLTVLILTALSGAAPAQEYGGKVQATGTTYATGVWDLTGPFPVKIPNSDIEWCWVMYTFEVANPPEDPDDWHGWRVYGESEIHPEVHSFPIEWGDFEHGPDFGAGQEIILTTLRCRFWNGEGVVYTEDNSLMYQYRTAPNTDADGNCGFGQSDQGRYNTYRGQLCGTLEEPEKTECAQTDYDKNGGVGQSDQGVLNLMWGTRLCTDSQWVLDPISCEALPWISDMLGDSTTSPPVPVSDPEAVCED